ncbi:MAG: hypothetical protein ABIR27_10550 [Dokdonella sp.]
MREALVLIALGYVKKMVTPSIWCNGPNGAGLQQWALNILKPLDEEGTIRLIGATDFFDSDAFGGCSDFADIYHQNSAGRSRFSSWLIPRLDTLLYEASN